MLVLTGNELTIEGLISVARHDRKVGPLPLEVAERLQASRAWVAQAVASGAVIYGVTTGFGPLATTGIPAHETQRLSRNLVLNCLAGVGDPLPEDIVRAMILVRANSLAKGFSGVRSIIVETLLEMLNRRVTPWVPEKGSLGASGDLAPLAHIAVVLSKDPDEADGGYSGQAWYKGALRPGNQAMKDAGLERQILEAKEGLALTNGTTFMSAAGGLALYDAEVIIKHAELATMLSLEALLGISAAFHPDLHAVNNQPGQVAVAARLLAGMRGSRLIDSAPQKVQDAYSLRCAPQVLGSINDTLAFLHDRFSAAINAASDNPLIFPEGQGQALSGGNFHGAGPAMWLDFLGIAVAEAGSIAERRIFRMLTPELSSGLPSMLVSDGGLDSGLMVAQYTAAALVSDNKTLAHPDSVDSIPSSANQEDHVSMGANAARHTREIVENVRIIIAIELMCAAQAIDLRPDGPARLGERSRGAYDKIRQVVPYLEHDRELTPAILSLEELICGETLLG